MDGSPTTPPPHLQPLPQSHPTLTKMSLIDQGNALYARPHVPVYCVSKYLLIITQAMYFIALVLHES